MAQGGSAEDNASGTAYYTVLATNSTSPDYIAAYATYLRNRGYAVRGIVGRDGYPVSATKGNGTFYIGLFSDYVRLYGSFFSEQTAIHQLEADVRGRDPRSLIIVEWEQ